MDFGIAKRQRQTKSAEAITSTGFIAGTTGYMAPEQYADFAAVGPAANIHALGVIAYGFSTGRRLFATDNPVEILHAQLAGTTTSARKINPQVPRALDELVGRMLARRAEQRPASCEEVAATLVAIAAADATALHSDDRAAPGDAGAERAHQHRVAGLDLPARTLSSSRIGIDALDVLPTRSMLTRTFSFGTPRRVAAKSMMRRFAWCGQIQSTSSRGQARGVERLLARGVEVLTATLKMSWPFMWTLCALLLDDLVRSAGAPTRRRGSSASCASEPSVWIFVERMPRGLPSRRGSARRGRARPRRRRRRRGRRSCGPSS